VNAPQCYLIRLVKSVKRVVWVPRQADEQPSLCVTLRDEILAFFWPCVARYSDRYWQVCVDCRSVLMKKTRVLLVKVVSIYQHFPPLPHFQERCKFMVVSFIEIKILNYSSRYVTRKSGSVEGFSVEIID
jgi:hypothetical protein